MIDSSLWTGRVVNNQPLRFGFRGPKQLPLFLVWREYWNADHTDVDHASIILKVDHLWMAPKMCWRFLEDQWWRYWAFSHPMSKCRVCGSSKDVAFFDPRGLWAYPFRDTLCPNCCQDHDYEYDSSVGGKCCIRCGGSPPDDYYCYDDY